MSSVNWKDLLAHLMVVVPAGSVTSYKALSQYFYGHDHGTQAIASMLKAAVSCWRRSVWRVWLPTVSVRLNTSARGCCSCSPGSISGSGQPVPRMVRMNGRSARPKANKYGERLGVSSPINRAGYGDSVGGATVDR